MNNKIMKETRTRITGRCETCSEIFDYRNYTKNSIPKNTDDDWDDDHSTIGVE